MKSWSVQLLMVTAVLTTTATLSAGDGEVAVRVFQFRPGQLEVKAGTRVVWTNADDITHTITAGTPERRDGGFDLSLDGKGATAAHRFTGAGVYPYFCRRHPSMRGEVQVK